MCSKECRKVHKCIPNRDVNSARCNSSSSREHSLLEWRWLARAVARGMAAVSSVWLHFEKVVAEHKAVCLHCKKQYKYEKGGTTSALLRHLNKKHQTKIKQEQAIVKTEAQHPTEIKQEGAVQPELHSIQVCIICARIIIDFILLVAPEKKFFYFITQIECRHCSYKIYCQLHDAHFYC